MLFRFLHRIQKQSCKGRRVLDYLDGAAGKPVRNKTFEEIHLVPNIEKVSPVNDTDTNEL